MTLHEALTKSLRMVGPKIEVGKTYVTRDGLSKVRITRDIGRRGTYRFEGEDDKGRITWRSAKGRFTDHPHPHDLVEETH